MEAPIEEVKYLRFTPDGTTLVSMRYTGDGFCEVFRWVAAVPGAWGLDLGQRTIRGVRLDVAPDASACVRSVELGGFAAAPMVP